MNTIPCKQCVHFDQQYKYQAGRKVEVWYGHCKKRSLYPVREWDPAQPFDVDVKRVAQGTDRSQILVVDKAGTRPECTSVVKVIP